MATYTCIHKKGDSTSTHEHTGDHKCSIGNEDASCPKDLPLLTCDEKKAGDGGSNTGKIVGFVVAVIIVVVAVGWWLSDRRLKRDIVLLERLPNGIGLYAFRYRWRRTRYVGVMAQEVAQVVPSAVRGGLGGYLRVDYRQLGFDMMTFDEWQSSREQVRPAA